MSEKAYEDMDYAELQAAAKAANLPANGNKEALLERLQNQAPAETQDEPEEETAEEEDEGAEGGVETAEEAPEEEAKPAAKVTDKEVEKQLRGDAAKMKAHLDKQPKVAVMIPLEVGVAPEVAEKVPFVVNMNGYRFQIKRGTFVEVPRQVAEMVKERLESEGKIGRDKRIDRDQNTLDALG